MAAPEPSQVCVDQPLHMLPASAVYGALTTRPAGLTQTEIEERLRFFGANVIDEPPRTPDAVRFLANFTHVMAILLWAGGAIGFAAELPQLGIAIWMVNVINGTFEGMRSHTYRGSRYTRRAGKRTPGICVARVARMSMKVLIVGGGRVGAHLASLLINNGHSVTIIERRQEQASRLKQLLPAESVIYGSGTDPLVLEDAQIRQSDVLAAVTGTDETNLVATSLGRFEFGVRRTIARVKDP